MRVTDEPVTPQCLQKVTVVVHVSVVTRTGAVSTGADSVALVEFGSVNVTVVGVGAQLLQTLMVVVQPSGIEGVVEAGPEGGLVTPAVASGQTVVVMVVVIVVNPVGQISVYEVTMTVVTVGGFVVDGIGVTNGEVVTTEPVIYSPPFPVGWPVVEVSSPVALGCPVGTVLLVGETSVEETAELGIVDEEAEAEDSVDELTRVPVELGALETGVRVVGVWDGPREAEDELEPAVELPRDPEVEGSMAPAGEEQGDDSLGEATGRVTEGWIVPGV